MSVTYTSRIGIIVRSLPEELSASIEETAHDILDLAQQLCPVDTGQLRASGSVERYKGGWAVRFTAPYAVFVEYGTSVSPAQPFLTPAVRSIIPTARTYRRLRKLVS